MRTDTSPNKLERMRVLAIRTDPYAGGQKGIEDMDSGVVDSETLIFTLVQNS
jgi:hypothetical protein